MTRQALRHLNFLTLGSGPRGSSGIDVCSHCRQICDVTSSHPLQRSLTSKRLVWPFYPCVGLLRIRIQDFKRLPNAGHVADPSHRVLRKPTDLSFFPCVEGALTGHSEDSPRDFRFYIPFSHNPEKPFKSKHLALLGAHSQLMQICRHYRSHCEYAFNRTSR